MALAVLFSAELISTTAILTACMKKSWAVALVSLAVAATGVVVTIRHNPQGDYIDYQYRAHRTPLIKLAQDYRAGRDGVFRGFRLIPSTRAM